MALPEQKNSMSWYGKAAEDLGLTGENVSSKQFKSIMAGHVPGTDMRIGRQEAGEFKHTPGRDITFSAPDSVSRAALVLGDDRLIEAHNKAVERTLNYIEEKHLTCRLMVRKTGEMELVVGQKMLAVLFLHDTSRALVQNLQTHCVIANMILGEDGKWRGVHAPPLYRNIKLIGAVYDKELAIHCKALGYGVEKSGKIEIFELIGTYGQKMLAMPNETRRS
jgi:conjugative relaxase-like TrwC/TraI family protein